MIETPAMRAFFEVTGWTGVALFVIGWLVVSFRPPGPRRERIEWLATCSMYLTFLSLFAHLSLRALERDSHVATAAFGFMFVFFTVGLFVCLTQTVGVLRGKPKGPESATN